MMVLVLIIAARSKIYKYYCNLLEFFLFLEMVALRVVIHFSHFFFRPSPCERESGARENEYLNTSLILTGLPSKEFAIRSIKITFYFSSFSYLCGTITCSQLLLIIQFTFVCLHMSIPSSEWVSLNPFFIGSFFCSKTWNPISCFCSLQNGLLSSTISWLPYTGKVPLYTNTRFKKFFFYTRVNVGQFFLLVTTT